MREPPTPAPCPFCGRKVHVSEWRPGDGAPGLSYILCGGREGCGAQGPTRASTRFHYESNANNHGRDGIVKQWNTVAANTGVNRRADSET